MSRASWRERRRDARGEPRSATATLPQTGATRCTGCESEVAARGAARPVKHGVGGTSAAPLQRTRERDDAPTLLSLRSLPSPRSLRPSRPRNGKDTVIDKLGFLVRFWQLKGRHASLSAPLSSSEQIELLSLMQL